jgi:fumarylacetoacetase
MAYAEMRMPIAFRNFTDFFASIFHATNAGRLFRPDHPLTSNYKYVPLAYHSRASSVRISNIAVTRPNGQRKGVDGSAPSFGPSQRLDFELELGAFVGTASDLGRSVPIGAAANYIFGYCLLNDWSARDIQAWESQPLGPFLGKNFATTISPWVVTVDALAQSTPPLLPGQKVIRRRCRISMTRKIGHRAASTLRSKPILRPRPCGATALRCIA